MNQSAFQDRAWLPGVAPLRLVLVLALFFYQSAQIVGDFGRMARVAWILPHVLIPALFALAGLLAMQGITGVGIAPFLRRRTRRLLPLLLGAVLLPAVVIGPLLSVRPPISYFADHTFWAYFYNLLFWPQNMLPGVFALNKVALIVNDVMWCVPVVPAGMLALCAAALRPVRAVPVLVALLVAMAAVALMARPFGLDAALTNKLFGAAAAFLLGALAHCLGRRLPRHRAIVGVAAAMVATAAFMGQRTWVLLPWFDMLLALPIALMVTMLARMMPWTSPLVIVLQRYLGGVFLFAFPIQQSVASLGSINQGLFAHLALSFPPTLILAVLSWHAFERRTAMISIGAGMAVGAAVSPLPFDAASALSWDQARRLFHDRLPELGLWVLFLLLACAVMALTIFAFQPDRNGI